MIKDKKYYVLALSHKRVQLYVGDKYGLEPVAVRKLPSDMKKTLRIDEYPNWRETHSIAPVSTGKGSQASHGQYNVHETDKKMLMEYFRRVDKQLHFFLLGKNEPLILAGVNYLLPIYRKVNSYPFLAAKGLNGNVDNANLDELHEQTWALTPFPHAHVTFR